MLARQLSIEASYGAGIMAPLPDGAVDIKAVMRFLEAKHFTGPVVVEQDIFPGYGAPKESAQKSRVYLRSLGI